MVTAADVIGVVDAETLAIGKIHPIPFQRFIEALEIVQNSTDFMLLENILDMLSNTGKLKRINGNPPMFIKT